MEKFFFEDMNSVWMKPVKRVQINPEEVEDVNTISMILINEFSQNIHYLTNRIIYKELFKRPKASLHQQLLIKRQIINNVCDNITSITINMAKEKLDIFRTDIETTIVEQILEPVLMTYNNSYLDEQCSMQVDQEEKVDIM
jgi:hypothetical protein